MRHAWFLSITVVGAAMIGVATFKPKALYRVEMASEVDGVHQDDHKVLGVLPYSTTRRDPSLRVTADAFRALTRAGVPDLPEAHRRLPSYPVSRAFYPGKTDYVVQFELGKKSARDVADFYARGLTKPVRTHGSTLETVQGICPDGKTRLEFIAFSPPTTPAQLRLSSNAPL